MTAVAPPPAAAAAAFDAIAGSFDDRYGSWRSVAAQRRAVRRALLRAFPAGSCLLEIGCGTGSDAAWLTDQGRQVLATDASAAMVRVAAAKLRARAGAAPRVVAAESLEQLAAEREAQRLPPFDGAFSSFAALNCVTDLRPVGRGLARLVRPGGRVLLVVFGTASPGEAFVQLVRGDLDAAFRRRARGDVPARLGARHFTVRYHRAADLAQATAPWFRPVGRRGIGILVPPSAAEPWISRHPAFLGALEWADRILSRPFASFGDHVLYDLERTTAPVQGQPE